MGSVIVLMTLEQKLDFPRFGPQSRHITDAQQDDSESPKPSDRHWRGASGSRGAFEPGDMYKHSTSDRYATATCKYQLTAPARGTTEPGTFGVVVGDPLYAATVSKFGSSVSVSGYAVNVSKLGLVFESKLTTAVSCQLRLQLGVDWRYRCV
jgi:hypothetical protein